MIFLFFLVIFLKKKTVVQFAFFMAVEYAYVAVFCSFFLSHHAENTRLIWMKRVSVFLYTKFAVLFPSLLLAVEYQVILNGNFLFLW